MAERPWSYVSDDFDPTASPPLDPGEMEQLGDRLFAARSQDVLDRQIAYLPASYDSDQHLLYFPSIGMKWLEMKGGFDSYQPTMDYLLSQLPLEVVQSGVTMVINGRNVQSNVSRQLLERIASSFPTPIREVHLITMSGFFGFKKAIVSEAVASKIHLVYTYELTGVTKHIRAADLPTECGGELDYDHGRWILHKLAEERMLFYYEQTMDEVKKSISPLKERLVVRCYDDVEQLLVKHLDQKEAIINEINETREIVKKFVSYLEREDAMSATMAMTQQHVSMVTQLKTFVASLDEEESKFNAFWVHHKAVLDHKMYLGYFLRSVEKTKSLLEGHLSDLTSPDAELAADLETALDRGQRHEAFVTKLKQTIDDNLRKLQDEGKQLCEPLTIPGSSEVVTNPYQQESSEMVEEGLRGLAHQYEVVMKKCRQKRDLCIVCVNYHIGAQECEKWWTAVSDFFSEDPLQDNSTEAVSVAIGKVDQHYDRFPEANVHSLKKIAKCIPDKTFKKGASRHVSKCHKHKEKLESKRAELLKVLALSFQAPPPPPTPPPPPMSPTETTAHPTVSSPDSLDSSSVRSDDHQDGLSASVIVDQAARARQFIYDELVATETDYLRDLRAVILGYYDEMAPENNRVPVRLRGKRPVIFGNLQKIYKFHEQTFIMELKKHANDPAQVGEAFLEHGEGFELYEEYCKNRPNSEELLQEVREVEQVFFQEIQTSLGHQLPLASYLLKPVQRITKYQLLLKDLIKHTSDSGLDTARDTLVLALERMLNILRYLNNSMKVIGLRGFPGSLVDQGRLLIQDVFQVSEVSKQGRIFPRMSRRHVFLFEKVVVFSKLQEGGGSQQEARRSSQEGRKGQKEAYIYKEHIPMSDLGLRDTVDGQPLEFHLTLHSQHKSFKLVATSLEIKITWTTEVSRLLQEQLSQARNRASLSTLEVRQPAGDSRSGLSIEKIDGRFRASIRKKKKPSPPPIPNFNGNGVLPSAPGVDQEVVVGDSHMSRSVSVGSFDTDDDIANVEDSMYETLAPGAVKDYVAISDYLPGSAENDIGLVEGQQVEVVGINQYGWWWVRASDYDEQLMEGWVPAGYLQPITAPSE